MFGFNHKTSYLPASTRRLVQEPEKDMSAYYTVGRTTDDRTQLTFGQDRHVKSSLTMTDDAVVHMIRLLAVNIADTHTVTVTPVVQDNESEETTGEVE